MDNIQNVECITEGETEVLVFKNKFTRKGPGSKDKVPFYNPAMEINRDLSILVNQWIVNNSKKPVNILDGLAASGIRGIRLANELKGNFNVTINDWSKDEHDLIKKNLKHCGLKNVVASNRNLNALLSEERFHYIDVDPFGSPVYFIDSAIRGIYKNGVIACTSTDTATLCGVYPKVCLRRYGVRSFHSPVMHEIGLRILIGFICREAAKYDKGIEPLVCYSTDHYFRVYVRVKNGINYTNKTVDKLKNIKLKELFFSSKKTTEIGPLWVGKIQNKKVIEELRTILSGKQFNTKNILWLFLDLLEEEADAPAFFYNTNDIASLLKISPPKMKYLFEKLKERGYNTSRTHFSPTGFKTNAPREEIELIFKNQK